MLMYMLHAPSCICKFDECGMWKQLHCNKIFMYASVNMRSVVLINIVYSVRLAFICSTKRVGERARETEGDEEKRRRMREKITKTTTLNFLE